MRIIVTGSIAYDYLMSFPGSFSEHILPDKIDVLSVSFLVDSLRREPGGCAANIAYNLALLGERPTVLATVGADFAADEARLKAAGVDTSGIVVVDDHLTASFFVSTDQQNRQIASFYVGAMGAASRLSLTDLAAAGRATNGAAQRPLVIISPNAPDAMDKSVRECQALGWPYIYDPSQQIVRLGADELRRGIEGSLMLLANEYEFELIHDKTGLSIDDVLAKTAILIITRGEHGSDIHADGRVYHVPAVPPTRLVDPTGVGDAYRSGVMLGWLHGLSWPVAGRVGALAATYALEHLGTQAHRYTLPEFMSRYAASFGQVPAELSQLLGGTQETPRGLRGPRGGPGKTKPRSRPQAAAVGAARPS